MDLSEIINMIPSKTVKKHFIKNNIELTPIEALIITRYSFEDITVKEELYNRFASHTKSHVRDYAVKFQNELSILRSYLTNESGELEFQVNGSNIAHRNFKTLVESLEQEYCKVHIEDAKSRLVATLCLNKERDIILYKLWNEEEALRIFDIKFNSLPFIYKQLLKPVEQLFENQGESYVNLSDMNETVPGALAIVNMNDYITDVDHAEDEPPIIYMSPLYLEDYGLEGTPDILI